MNNELDLLDLDALMPKPFNLKVNGSIVVVQPPRTGDLLVLGNLSRSMDDLTDQSEEEVNRRLAGLSSLLVKMIPELSGMPLGLPQLRGLVAAFTKMSMPPDTRVLKEKGITADTPKAIPQG